MPNTMLNLNLDFFFFFTLLAFDLLHKERQTKEETL